MNFQLNLPPRSTCFDAEKETAGLIERWLVVKNLWSWDHGKYQRDRIISIYYII